MQALMDLKFLTEKTEQGSELKNVRSKLNSLEVPGVLFKSQQQNVYNIHMYIEKRKKLHL